MEHRWGERLVVDIPVQVSVPPLLIGSGRIQNISISGAWISGQFDLPPLARAFVVFELDLGGMRESMPIACYVTRVRPEGIGVEWRELAPQIVSDLMLFFTGTHASPGEPLSASAPESHTEEIATLKTLVS